MIETVSLIKLLANIIIFLLFLCMLKSIKSGDYKTSHQNHYGSINDFVTFFVRLTIPVDGVLRVAGFGAILISPDALV